MDDDVKIDTPEWLTKVWDKINSKFKSMSTARKALAVFFLLLMIGAIVIVVTVGQTRITTIKYGDGCEEIYINGELNGSVCEHGRQLKEIFNTQGRRDWHNNIQFPEWNNTNQTN